MTESTLATGSPIDLPRLLETRLLIQANSGGGKSWALRRLLEQTTDQVQQIVIDPEGEFASLGRRATTSCARHMMRTRSCIREPPSCWPAACWRRESPPCSTFTI